MDQAAAMGGAPIVDSLLQRIQDVQTDDFISRRFCSMETQQRNARWT
jgi:hypothetical protein